MKVSHYFCCIIFLFATVAQGQLSMTNPSICHDRNNYLSSYSDGNFLLNFSSGNFKEVRTSDNFVRVSDSSRVITFIYQNWDSGSLVSDSIEIKLLTKSILLKNSNTSLEITSLKNIPKEIYDYHINPYSENDQVRGFTFWSGNKYGKINIQTFGNAWSWGFLLKENNLMLGIAYNSFKKNRVQHVFIQDDSLRFGMNVSMTFKSLKRVSKLESVYYDTLNTLSNGSPVIGRIQLAHYYKYAYNKKGKLHSKSSVSGLKPCNPE